MTSNKLYAGYEPLSHSYFLRVEADVPLIQLLTLPKTYRLLGFSGVFVKRRLSIFERSVIKKV